MAFNLGSLWYSCPRNLNITVGQQARHKMLSLRPWQRRNLHPKHSFIYRQVETDLLHSTVTYLRYGYLVHWTVGTTAEKSNGNSLHPELASQPASQPYTSSFVRAAEVAGSRLAFFQRRALKTTFRNAVRLWGYLICALVPRLPLWFESRNVTAMSPIWQRPLLPKSDHDLYFPQTFVSFIQTCVRTLEGRFTECVRRYVQQCWKVGLVLSG
jgi:hypothetical protein